ncbi:MAG: hypothetical protein IKE53_10290 [Clostridiales bacterium]|nr:hypothetical protein [Clostridiales bacterium]
MIQDSFIEVHYKRKNGVYGILFTIFSIIALLIVITVLNVVPIFMGYNIIYFTGLISFGLCYLVYLINKKQHLVYEIEISNDEFDVARIIANKKREELASFSIKDCEYIGPVTSDRFSEDSANSESSSMFPVNARSPWMTVTGMHMWIRAVSSTKLHLSLRMRCIPYSGGITPGG